ncbi:MAG: TlpA disulfide reductase family protein [Vicingaceae bacterium]
MKKLIILPLVLFACFTGVYSQGAQIPEVTLKDINERPFNTADIDNDGKPIIINFWATWCSPCKRELNNIAELYPDWVEETGVKIYAVTIDDARNVGKVEPYVNGKGWEYEILLDMNQDLKRAMSVNNIPHTFLVDHNKQVVWQHNSYSEGDEYHLYELVQKLARGEEIKE